MKTISFQSMAIFILFMMICASYAQEGEILFVEKASVRVSHAMTFNKRWDGPISGPKLAQNKLVVFIGNDVAGDTSMRQVANTVKSVAVSMGWAIQIIDCYGRMERRAESFSRAFALKPATIIFAGADAKSVNKQIESANDRKIPVIGWHASTLNGPSDGLFTNVGTNPTEAGELAALLGISQSAKAGVVVLTDTDSSYSTAKSLAITSTIKRCKTCTLLALEGVSPEETPEQLIQRIAELQRKYGTRMSYLMATSDHLLDVLETNAANSILGEIKFQAIAAGVGSRSAFIRIRSKKIQIGTVPEPLNMQGWQLIDEINRALAGEKASGYVPASYIVTAQNIGLEGGQNNSFDPDNGYQAVYKGIWGP